MVICGVYEPSSGIPTCLLVVKGHVLPWTVTGICEDDMWTCKRHRLCRNIVTILLILLSKFVHPPSRVFSRFLPRGTAGFRRFGVQVKATRFSSREGHDFNLMFHWSVAHYELWLCAWKASVGEHGEEHICCPFVVPLTGCVWGELGVDVWVKRCTHDDAIGLRRISRLTLLK